MAKLNQLLRTLGSRRAMPMIAGFTVLALIVFLQIAYPAPFERLRLQVFDGFQIASPRPEMSEALVGTVDIDEDSIRRLGQWPWPRTDIARLTDRLEAAGAKAIVFDIVMSEPDRTSPENIAARYEQNGEQAALTNSLSALPSHDSILANSFSQSNVITGYFLYKSRPKTPNETSPENAKTAFEPKASFTIHGSLPSNRVTNYKSSLQPLPALEEAAKGNGFLSLQRDDDGIVRRAPLVAILNDQLIAGLSIEAVRVASDKGSPNLLTSDGSGETLAAPGSAVAVRLDEIEIPVNEAGEMWVHFPKPRAQEVIPAWQVISGEMNDEDLAAQAGGKIIFVGGSAAGLQDLVSTPASSSIAGVSVHVAATEQILSGHFLERPDWGIYLERFLAILLGALLALLLPKLGAVKGAIAAIFVISGAVIASWLAFDRALYLLDPTLPILTLIAVYTVQTVIVYYGEEQQRSYIRSAFDRYLSPEMVRQIAANPDKLELGGEERDMSVLMCDIRGFSRISERYSPKDVITFLINFLTPMSDILLERRATLDKYIGDAILAFWNAPLDDPDHHKNSARAALDMIAQVKRLNEELPDKIDTIWPGEVKVGIGLNSGLCCVGNMGSAQRLSYTLIGDTVNIAARLEGLTKQYGVPILAGQSLAKELDGLALFETDRVQVVGREGVEEIYALLGDEEVCQTDEFIDLAGVHAQMLSVYRAQNWQEARDILSSKRSAYEHFGISPLNELFANRIETLATEKLPEDWNGTYQATAK